MEGRDGRWGRRREEREGERRWVDLAINKGKRSHQFSDRRCGERVKRPSSIPNLPPTHLDPEFGRFSSSQKRIKWTPLSHPFLTRLFGRLFLKLFLGDLTTIFCCRVFLNFASTFSLLSLLLKIADLGTFDPILTQNVNFTTFQKSSPRFSTFFFLS